MVSRAAPPSDRVSSLTSRWILRVDMAATEASPWAACKSHNAESGAQSLRLTTCRKHKMSGAEPGRVCEGNIGDGLLLRPQEGNVCTWITTDETCGDLVSVPDE